MTIYLVKCGADVFFAYLDERLANERVREEAHRSDYPKPLEVEAIETEDEP